MDVVHLFKISPRSRFRRLAINVYLEETPISITELTTMRCVFNIEIKVDLDADDSEQRAAFIRLASEAARSVYAPAVMIAKRAPTITMNETSREGKREIPLFADATS